MYKLELEVSITHSAMIESIQEGDGKRSILRYLVCFATLQHCLDTRLGAEAGHRADHRGV